MSRVVVKNLPKQISQEELKKHFSKKGNITDVRLIYKDGEFRRYAFIGFEGEGDAATACEFYHNTFINQAKIAVELCQELGKGQKPMSWAEKNKEHKEEQAQLKSSATNSSTVETEEEDKTKKKKHKKKDKDLLKEKLLDQYKDDPTFGEFLKANEKGAREESNTSATMKGKDDKSEEEGEEEENEHKLAQKKDISDEDYLKSLKKAAPQDKEHIEGTKPKKTKVWKELHEVVIRAKQMCKDKDGNSCTFTKKSIKAFLRPVRFKSLRIPQSMKMVAYIGFETEQQMKQTLQKDRSILDGVRVRVVKVEKKPAPAGDKIPQSNTPWSAKEEALKSADPVAESGKLFVRNLWYSVTEDLLQELFQKYGEVTDITLPICKDTRRPKGFATVTFMFPEHAVKAMSELDGTNFKGRILHILPGAEPKTESKQKDFLSENISFKEKKAQEKKETAGSWHNWNSLFLGTDAVVDIMAERYNRSKQEILDSEGKQSVAVNLALGETQVVDETRRFLKDNGVSLAAFSNVGVQRSKTIFLVKNLPAKTTAQELVELFCKFGELGRVVLPPSGVTGVVEFLDSGEARKAFRNLAYSRFKSMPLYLEWAPVKVFKTEFKAKAEEMEDKSMKEEEAPSVAQQDPEPDTTLYVKNLNFSTTEDILKQHFERIGTVYSVLIAKQRGQSQGYGFVQFLRRADAFKALREMNESTLEDHTLQIKLSEKTLVTTLKSARRVHDAGQQTSSKIHVKNIPFQATPEEVRQLFVTFGELKSLRLPQKPGSKKHRGYGFVDFVSREDAKKAFDALSLSTHLYDRRLVLEWAKGEETVEDLRKRTAEHFLGAGPSQKRGKVQVDDKMKDDPYDR